MIFNENSRVKIPAILHLMRLGYTYMPLNKQNCREDSKMLTHKNVSITQVYAELVSEKKRESANKISLK